MKQSNDSWNVRRCIHFPDALEENDLMAVMRHLEELPGVISVAPGANSSKLYVSYDASGIDFNTLTLALEAIGLSRKSGWWENIKARMYQFSDTNARDNAHAPPPPCCNKPPK